MPRLLHDAYATLPASARVDHIHQRFAELFVAVAATHAHAHGIRAALQQIEMATMRDGFVEWMAHKLKTSQAKIRGAATLYELLPLHTPCKTRLSCRFTRICGAAIWMKRCGECAWWRTETR